MLLASEDTHGEHKAASVLTLQAVQQLPVEHRPIVLSAQASGGDSGSYQPLRNYLLTATSSSFISIAVSVLAIPTLFPTHLRQQ